MSWAQRLKHVFSVEFEIGEKCGSQVKIIASVEAPM
jgi:hypothetical protein